MTSAPSDAALQVKALEQRVGPALVELGSHAALPVVLNPELLHLIRINFLLDTPNPPAFADEDRLLFSTLCHELGDGLYEVKGESRGLLLGLLEARHGPQRIRDVAALLWQYCERGAWSARPELERAQQLTALNFLDPGQAKGWLDRQESNRTGEAAAREWLVAMQVRLATLNNRPAWPNEQPPMAVEDVVSELQRLDFAEQQAAYRNASTSPIFVISGPVAHAQRWLLYRLVENQPGTAIIDIPVVALVDGNPSDAVSDAMRRGIPSQNNSVSGPSQPDAYAIVVDVVEPARVVPAIEALSTTSWQFTNAGLQQVSVVGSRGRESLSAFVLDHFGVTLPRVPTNVTILPVLKRFTAEVLKFWLAGAGSAFLNRLDAFNVDAAADDIIANSEKGVPERAMEYICWRCGVPWREVMAAAAPRGLRMTQAAERTPADVLDATRALAKEYDRLPDDRRLSGAPEVLDILKKARRLRQVSDEALSELEASPSEGERLLALVLLQEHPDPRFLEHLARSVMDKAPLVRLHAAVGLCRAAEVLPAEHLNRIRGLVAQLLAPDLGLTAAGDVGEALNWAATAVRNRVDPPNREVPRLALELGKAYDRLRRQEPVGQARTAHMTDLFDGMRALPAMPDSAMRALMSSESAGERLVAIAALQERPHAAYLMWVAERPAREKWFVGFQATVALRRAAELLRRSDGQALRGALTVARAGIAVSGDPNQAAALDAADAALSLRFPHKPARAGAAARPAGIWNLWAPGSTLRIKFLDGDPVIQRRVAAIAQEWTTYANIVFRFISTGSRERPEVRITFDISGAWSYIGTDALAIPASQPTMCLGWLTRSTPESEYPTVVLRMFGYVLGLINEIMSPNAQIQWNKEVVYRELTGPPNNWSKEQVDWSFLAKYKKSKFPWYRPFDPDSIMSYPFPAHWTLDGFSIGPAPRLSEADKMFIAQLYPREGPSIAAVVDSSPKSRQHQHQPSKQAPRTGKSQPRQTSSSRASRLSRPGRK